MLVNAALSALANLVIFAVLPFLLYFLYHKWRHARGFKEISKRAGLCLGNPRYIGYCLALAIVQIAALLVWQPSTEVLIREGSAWKEFAGLGLGKSAIAMALLYGVVKTGFAEELLFRGLIAGSLSRKLSLPWANLLQSLIFLAPHVFIVLFMPEAWGVLILIFVGSLFLGWARIRSGSIIGPWLIHASANVTMGLYVAIQTAGQG